MSIRYDTIRGGVIIVLSFLHFFLLIFLEQLYLFSGLCGFFGRRLARTGLLTYTSLCWFGLLFLGRADDLEMSGWDIWSTFS